MNTIHFCTQSYLWYVSIVLNTAQHHTQHQLISASLSGFCSGNLQLESGFSIASVDITGVWFCFTYLNLKYQEFCTSPSQFCLRAGLWILDLRSSSWSWTGLLEWSQCTRQNWTAVNDKILFPFLHNEVFNLRSLLLRDASFKVDYTLICFWN